MMYCSIQIQHKGIRELGASLVELTLFLPLIIFLGFATYEYTAFARLKLELGTLAKESASITLRECALVDESLECAQQVQGELLNFYQSRLPANNRLFISMYSCTEYLCQDEFDAPGCAPAHDDCTCSCVNLPEELERLFITASVGFVTDHPMHRTAFNRERVVEELGDTLNRRGFVIVAEARAEFEFGTYNFKGTTVYEDSFS